MTTAIRIGLGGIAGWRVLERIESRQVAATASNPVVHRSVAYLRDTLAASTTPQDLVGDYRMMQVVLGALGLDGDMANKAFIRKVLESEVGDAGSLVNRLGDKRYRTLAQQFQNRDKATTREAMAEAYVQQQFQKRVGQGDESYRLALNARDELRSLATRTSSDRTLWYEVLGNNPLRKVFEGAFGFGSSMANLSVDRQLEEFTKASERLLGTQRFAELGTAGSIDTLVTRFLATSQVQANTASNRYSAALSLLTS